MFGDRWQAILGKRGDATALWVPGGQISFRELDARARVLPTQKCPKLGAFYLAQGDGCEVACALLAAFLTGRPVHVVERDRLRRVPKTRPPRGTALIKQTVGSSGSRRCQFFSFAQIAADADRLHAALKLEACDAAVAAVSVAHSFGLSTTLLQTLLHGLPVHWLPNPFPSAVAEALAQHERAFLPGVPAMWKAWLLAGLNSEHIGLAVSAGSTLTANLEAQVWEAMRLKLHNLYGTSECGAISYDASAQPRTDSEDLGLLLPGVRAVEHRDGRLLVTSDAVALGYDEIHPNELLKNAEHLTWDRVRMDGQRLTFRHCLGAGINVASRKLSPADIAAKIKAATGLGHVRVYGRTSRDSERVQDIVVAVDVPEAELTHAFKAHACAALASWEVPRQWQSEQPPPAHEPVERSKTSASPPGELGSLPQGEAIPAL